MNHSIQPGLVPPGPGLEKEEPELSDEEDIPSDDDRGQPADEELGERRPLRNIERE